MPVFSTNQAEVAMGRSKELWAGLKLSLVIDFDAELLCVQLPAGDRFAHGGLAYAEVF
jgi:hypothetical protein